MNDLHSPDLTNLNAMLARRRGRNTFAAERQEQLLIDARKWAEAELRELASETHEAIELKTRVVKQTYDQFLPTHRNRADFILGYREFESALWDEGTPSLEDLAKKAIQERSASGSGSVDTPPRSAKPQFAWEDLAAAFRACRQSSDPLRAEWSAREGSEQYGIWLLRPQGPQAEEARELFNLTAARAIKKLGIPPIPTPQPLEHNPRVPEQVALLGGELRSDEPLVPHGLREDGWDAVDPCTRQWLELLRTNSGGFQPVVESTTRFGNRDYKALTCTISDVCGASAVHCMRLEKDEIKAELMSRRLPHPPSKVGGISSVSRPSKRRIIGAIEFDYPPDFPEASRDRVKKEEISSARDFNGKLGSANSTKALRALRIACIMHPTTALCREAIQLGWGADRVDSLIHDFIDVSAGWAGLVLNPATRVEIEASRGWCECHDALLVDKSGPSEIVGKLDDPDSRTRPSDPGMEDSEPVAAAPQSIGIVHSPPSAIREDPTRTPSQKERPGETSNVGNSSKRRGAPTRIPLDRKRAALAVKDAGGSYRDAAKVLYDKSRPTQQEVKNASKHIARLRREKSNVEPDSSKGTE